MAVVPQIRKISPFPANETYTVYFDVAGISSQITYNEIEIKDNPSTGVKYQNLVQDFRYQHDIPLNSLVNGKQYSIKVRVYDINQVLLGESIPVLFYCFSRPVLTIPTIVNGQVNNQTVMFQGTYSQSQSELLQSYKYILYDSNKIILDQTTDIYNTNLTSEFTELENNKTYYIELKVITINQMESTTGLIQFIPQYVAPKFTSFLQLENNSENASIKITCNVIRIMGVSYNASPIYISGDKIDLTSNSVYFSDGFKVNGDFTLKMWLASITPNVTFFSMSTKDGITLELRFINNKIHIYKIKDGTYILQHIVGSTTITPLVTDTVFIDLRQIKNLYNLTYSIV